MIVEGIVLSIIVGYIRKGRLSNFEGLDIKEWYLLPISVAVQMLAITLSTNTTSEVGRFMYNNFYYFHLGSYILLIIVLLLNYKLLSMKLFGIGTILNLIPIAFNNGQMPVALPDGVNARFDMAHVLVNEATRFYFLSDIFPLLKPYPIPKVISIGDIFLVAGAFALIQYGMLHSNNKNKSEETGI